MESIESLFRGRESLIFSRLFSRFAVSEFGAARFCPLCPAIFELGFARFRLLCQAVFGFGLPLST